MEIKFCLLEQGFNSSKNPQGHAQKVMKDLGIEYDEARPESLFDCWIFKGCRNVPDELPPCIQISKGK